MLSLVQFPSSVSYQLCDFGQVTSPLCASGPLTPEEGSWPCLDPSLLSPRVCRGRRERQDDRRENHPAPGNRGREGGREGIEKWGPSPRLIPRCGPQGSRFCSSSLGSHVLAGGGSRRGRTPLGFPVSQGSVPQDEPRGPSATGTAGERGGTRSFATRSFHSTHSGCGP